MRVGRSSRRTSRWAATRPLRFAAPATLLAAALLSVGGCASVLSKAEDSNAHKQRVGLVYWLPKRDIKVTVTVPGKAESDSVTTVVAGPGDMRPDFDNKKFVLDYQPNLIGTNKLNVTVNSKGLLGAVVSETTVKLSEVLGELAKPSARVLKFRVVEADCPPGTYERLIEAKDGARDEVCGYKITVSRLSPPSVAASKSEPVDDFYDINGRSGIYYRQELPYLVEIIRDDSSKAAQPDKRSFLVFSPSESRVYFLPVRRTLFSNNKADLAFSEGVPTTYEQSTDGELIGLLKLPAGVIGAYFGAIGQMFQYRKGALDSEKQYLQAQSKLMGEMVKLQACKEAVNLGQTGDNLNAACGLQ